MQQKSTEFKLDNFFTCNMHSAPALLKKDCKNVKDNPIDYKGIRKANQTAVHCWLHIHYVYYTKHVCHLDFSRIDYFQGIERTP